jgi:hypothetical protein
MTEQAEEATRLSAAFAQAAKVWESLSAALSGEIALKNEALAARETEIARLHQRIAEMDAWGRAAVGRETALQQQLVAAEAEITRLHQRIAEMDVWARAAMGRETALQQQLAALYSSTSWRIAAPLRFAKHLLAHFLTLNNRLRGMVHVPSGKHFEAPPLPPVSGALVDPQRTELLVTDQLDLSAEPDTVRHLYLRLVRTRERMSGSR